MARKLKICHRKKVKKLPWQIKVNLRWLNIIEKRSWQMKENCHGNETKNAMTIRNQIDLFRLSVLHALSPERVDLNSSFVEAWNKGFSLDTQTLLVAGLGSIRSPLGFGSAHSAVQSSTEEETHHFQSEMQFGAGQSESLKVQVTNVTENVATASSFSSAQITASRDKGKKIGAI